MANPIPNDLALTTIETDAPILSADHRNNYGAIQTAVNSLVAALSGGSSGQVLQAAGTAAVEWGPKTTTSALSGGPPAAPADGDIWIATGVDTNGTRWQFQYNAGSASTYKWEFVGGSMVRGIVGTFESSTTVGSWYDLATVGPSVTAARAGDYRAQVGASVNSSVTQKVQLGASIGATNPVDNDGTVTDSNFRILLTRWLDVLNVGAGQDIRARYLANSAGTVTWGSRQIDIVPVRIA